MKNKAIILSLTIVFLLLQQKVFAQKSKTLLLAEAVFTWKSTGWQIEDTLCNYYDGGNNKTGDFSMVYNPLRDAILNAPKPTSTVSNRLRRKIIASDTALLANKYRNTFTYDANNNVITSLSEEWDDGKWNCDSCMTFETRNKTVYTYDAKNNKSSEIFMSWDKYVKAFSKSVEFTFSYDSANNLLKQTELSFNESGGVRRKIEYTFTYDSANNVLTELREEQGFTKTIYTYDGNKNVTSELKQVLDPVKNVFINNRKTTFAYNAANKITESFIQIRYSLNSAALTNDSKFKVTYDSIKGTALTVAEIWDRDKKKFIYAGNTTEKFDKKNNLTEKYFEAWDEEKKIFIKTSETKIRYDLKNNPAEETKETWTPAKSGEKYLYTYDSYNKKIAVLTQEWNEETNSYVNDRLEKYYYKKL